jgi:hypothetical protein
MIRRVRIFLYANILFPAAKMDGAGRAGRGRGVAGQSRWMRETLIASATALTAARTQNASCIVAM